MLIKRKNKKVGIGLMVVTTCIVVTGLWAVLAIPGTALAAPPRREGQRRRSTEKLQAENAGTALRFAPAT
jgi:hypothetical protein